MDVMEQIGQSGIIPVVVIEDAASAVPTAWALLDGGIRTMEITFRTPCAADAIQAVAKGVPDMLVGAGTILTVEQALRAKDAGARFIVSPGYSERLVDYCIAEELPVIPGCVTPSEVMSALSRGLSILKFFPANIYGGLPAMKALAGVFRGVRFVPTGGIGPGDIETYLTRPYIYALGGSWLCTAADIAAGNFDRITELARQASTSVPHSDL
ncbi:MAG: bifunctional 4-hydroxy-2-oxoglutarate aldolase/2-dehydro-3-deoxy-phosphogluconate aldolase [Oscillospiraceae bacterium]|nr:bifunctional 4-hydroxy-2-oxoglutarate aldolase/2-dehydro-3-deoxy-phosphogluconate aldolase [Oscillospiraceae bacterium]